MSGVARYGAPFERGYLQLACDVVEPLHDFAVQRDASLSTSLLFFVFGQAGVEHPLLPGGRLCFTQGTQR